MKITRVGLAIVLIGLGSAFGAYKMGRANGFDQGWDKGYIRGLENSTCDVDTSEDDEEVCINHECEAQQS